MFENTHSVTPELRGVDMEFPIKTKAMSSSVNGLRWKIWRAMAVSISEWTFKRART
jgi:hypothetical protein